MYLQSVHREAAILLTILSTLEQIPSVLHPLVNCTWMGVYGTIGSVDNSRLGGLPTTQQLLQTLFLGEVA